MSKSVSLRMLSIFAAVLLVFSLGTAIYADTTAPAATDGTAAITSTDGPLGTTPESTTGNDPTDTPETSSMMDSDITTTPDTVDTQPDDDNTMDGDDKPDDGFNYTGLIIALVIAAAVILLIVLLVPKNKNKR